MAVGATTPAHPLHRSPPDTGRESELRLAEELLAEGPVRLVTFTGPAGVGKTWTAHQLMRRLMKRGSILEASLADARDFGDLLQAVARAVDVRPSWAPLAERISSVLEDGAHLALLDGCELLSGTTHPVRRLLDLCPSLRVVATSLRPLKVEGERVIGLDPFPVPRRTADVSRLRASPAVRLFCARAAEIDHGFDPDSAEVVAIAEACRRVHGLPLGIEILATRMSAESPAALVDELDRGSDVAVRHSGTDDDPRHLSLRAAVDWSYAVIGPTAARLLRRMAVFAAPATMDMIATVAVAPSSGPASQPAYSGVADTVSALVDARLVETYDSGLGEPAFVVVELVRQHALERLVAEGELAWCEDAHTRAVLDFVLARSEAVETLDDEQSQAELARAESDIRAALHRLVSRADVDEGLLLATALAPFVLRRGYDGFVGPALSGLLRRAREHAMDDLRLARAFFWKAWLAVQLAEADAASDVRSDLAEGLRLARRSGDERTMLLGFSLVMQTLPVTGDVEAVSAAATEGLPLAEAVEASGGERWLARFCARAGIVAAQTGHVDEAVELASRGIGRVTPDDARAQILLWMLLSTLPRAMTRDLAPRLPSVQDLVQVARRLGDPRYEPPLLRAAAWLAVQDHEFRTAAARCLESLRLLQQQGAWVELPFVVVPLTMVAAGRRHHEEVARFHGMLRSQVDMLRRALPPDRVEAYLRVVEVARAALGPAAFESLAGQGETEMRADALSGPLSYAASVAASGRPRQTGGSGPTAFDDPAQLTPRERDVLGELVTGATNNEISRRLGMAPKTVMHHSVAIYRKLGVRGRAEATAWAFRHGLVE